MFSIDFTDFDELKKVFFIILVSIMTILLLFGMKWKYISIVLFFFLLMSPFIILNLSDKIEKIQRKRFLSKGFSTEWRTILKENVVFYNRLDEKEQKRFEKYILYFLLDYKIESIDTKIEDIDRLLVASSGIIPVFGFSNWNYIYLETITLFEESFEFAHPFIESGQLLNGLVDKNGNMYLSKSAVRNGFAHEKDGENTAMHEFMHLLDMDDGEVDGVPEAIIKSQYIIPWINLMEEEIERICQENSILRDYACSNRQEFFADASVCFFENPRLLAIKHPKLYDMLVNIFDQDVKRKKK